MDKTEMERRDFVFDASLHSTGAGERDGIRNLISGFPEIKDIEFVPHKTPIKNLFLSGAWTQPGHGYGAVIPSGLQCFGEIMKEWGE